MRDEDDDDDDDCGCVCVCDSEERDGSTAAAGVAVGEADEAGPEEQLLPSTYHLLQLRQVGWFSSHFLLLLEHQSMYALLIKRAGEKPGHIKHYVDKQNER